jgi:hypothetical protein
MRLHKVAVPINQAKSKLNFILELFTKTANIAFHTNLLRSSSRDNSVGIVTVYGVDGRGLISSKGKTLLSTPQHPDRLWGPLSLLFSGRRGLFPRG